MARISKPPEERKQEILDKSMELIMKKGYENTSVQDIVKSLNVAQGLFYYYFKSKDELLEALAKEQMKGFEQHLYNALEKAGECDALTKLKIFYISLVEMHIYSPNKELFFELEKNIKFFAKHQQYENELFIKELVKIIDQGNEEGIFDCKYPREISHMIIAGCTEMMMADCLKEISNEDMNFHFLFFDIFDKYIDFLIYAASRLMGMEEAHMKKIIKEISEETADMLASLKLDTNL